MLISAWGYYFLKKDFLLHYKITTIAKKEKMKMKKSQIFVLSLPPLRFPADFLRNQSPILTQFFGSFIPSPSDKGRKLW